jgi:hypothetical protein
MSNLSSDQLKNLQKSGHAMPPSASNESDDPRFPIKGRGPGPNTLQAAIAAVGRARPNTPEERAKVRRYIMRVAAQHGWSSDIPDTWKSDGTLTTGGS